jgi:hypothetical protein
VVLAGRCQCRFRKGCNRLYRALIAQFSPAEAEFTAAQAVLLPSQAGSATASQQPCSESSSLTRHLVCGAGRSAAQGHRGNRPGGGEDRGRTGREPACHPGLSTTVSCCSAPSRVDVPHADASRAARRPAPANRPGARQRALPRAVGRAGAFPNPNPNPLESTWRSSTRLASRSGTCRCLP